MTVLAFVLVPSETVTSVLVTSVPEIEEPEIVEVVADTETPPDCSASVTAVACEGAETDSLNACSTAVDTSLTASVVTAAETDVAVACTPVVKPTTAVDVEYGESAAPSESADPSTSDRARNDEVEVPATAVAEVAVPLINAADSVVVPNDLVADASVASVLLTEASATTSVVTNAETDVAVACTPVVKFAVDFAVVGVGAKTDSLEA